MKTLVRSLAVLALLLACGPLRAQQKIALSASSTDCSVAGSCLSIGLYEAGQPGQVNQRFGGATITIGANASGNTIQFEASGDGGATWVAITSVQNSVSSSTQASSTTSTGTWQFNVAGYMNIRARMSTLAGGTTTVSAIPSIASAHAGGGGSGGGSAFPVTVSGTVTSGGIPCFNSTTNEQTSTLLPAGDFVLGGGAGACPTATFSVVPIANGGTGQATASAGFNALSPLTTLGDVLYGGASGAGTRLAGPTAPNGVPQFLTDLPSAGAAPAETFSLSGVPIDARTTTTETVLGTCTPTPCTQDRSSVMTLSNGGATALTVPDPATTNFTNNFNFAAFNINTGLVTATPGGSKTVNGNSNQIIPNHWGSFWYSDNTNYRALTVPDIAAFPNSPTNALGFTSATGVFGSITALTATSFTCGVLNTTACVFTGYGSTSGSATLTWPAVAGTTSNAIAISNAITTPSVATGTSPPTCTIGTAGALCLGEGTAPTGASNVDDIYANAANHCATLINNNTDVGCVAAIGQTNVYGAFLQDFTSGTMELPEGAGATANVNSTIINDTTANATHLWVNSADSIAAVEAAGITANVLTKSTDATHGLITASLATDNGTTLNYTGTGGITATKVNGNGAPVASTTAVTSSNPTINTDQNLIQLSLGAGYLNTLAQPFTITGSGIYSSTSASSPALTFKIKLCTVSACGSGTVVALANIVSTALNTTALTNATFNIVMTCVTNATGATGNLMCHGSPGLTLDTGSTLSTPDTLFADTNTAVLSNIDLTAALFVQFTIAQSVVGGSNSYTQQLAAIR